MPYSATLNMTRNNKTKAMLICQNSNFSVDYVENLSVVCSLQKTKIALWI